MKFTSVFLIITSLFLATFMAHARGHRGRKKGSSVGAATATMAHMVKVGACKLTDNPKKILIIKQWHLGPKVITRSFKEKYPQERNQTAIYQALAGNIKNKSLQLLVAEGCEGAEINSSFKTAWNGWDYNELHRIAQTKGYDKIITHVPLKLEARFDDGVKTVCGDNEALIQEGNLRLSNLRGWAGYWTRLHEKYIDDRGKMYSDAATDLLKIPKDTPLPELLKKIHAQMTEELGAFKNSLNARNDSFVKALQSPAAGDFQTAAVVIGGLHAEDLRAKVEAAGFNCEVLEPPGYQKEDEQLVGDFERAVAGGN